MNRKQALVQIAAALVAAFALAPAAHANTAQEGVRCPSGATAQIGNANRHLVCIVEERIERASVCSPVVFRNNGDINLNQRVDLLPAGSDTCRSLATGATAPSQALLLPGDDAAQFRREVRANAPDVFVATRRKAVFPVGGPVYVGDAAKGVSCGAGFDGDATFNGNGIRCDRRERRRATCDAGWTVDRNSGTDRCFIEQVVFGNRIRVDGQYTIPEGTTGLTGNPESHGWNLEVDRDGRVDFWAREVREYAFPKSTP